MLDAQACFTIDQPGVDLRMPPEAAAPGFARHHALVCRDALAPALVDRLDRLCAGSDFVREIVPGLGDQDIEAPARAGRAILLLLARPPLLAWLSAATGCGPLAGVDGRVRQSRARPDHRLDWHDDRNDDRRRLAVTIALPSPAFDGGLFELRRKGQAEPLVRFRHDRPGTALIFAVDDALEHRVVPIAAGGPRRVFAGWFLA